jgi:hypothetical protein
LLQGSKLHLASLDIPIILEIIQAYRSSASTGVKMYMLKNPSIYMIENVHDEKSPVELVLKFHRFSLELVIEERLILQFRSQFWCV